MIKFERHKTLRLNKSFFKRFLSNSILFIFTVEEDDKNFHQPCSEEETTSDNVEDLKYLSPIKKTLLILYCSSLFTFRTTFKLPLGNFDTFGKTEVLKYPASVKIFLIISIS